MMTARNDEKTDPCFEDERKDLEIPRNNKKKLVSVSQTVVGKAFEGKAIANCRNALVKCIKMQPIRKRDIPYIQNCKQHIQT